MATATRPLTVDAIIHEIAQGDIDTAQETFRIATNGRSILDAMVTDDRIVVARLEGAAKRHGGWTAPEGEARDAAIADLRRLGGDDEALYAQAAGIMLGCHPEGDSQHDRYRIAAHLLLDAAGITEADERVGEWVAVGRERRTRTQQAHRVGDVFDQPFGG